MLSISMQLVVRFFNIFLMNTRTKYDMQQVIGCRKQRNTKNCLEKSSEPGLWYKEHKIAYQGGTSWWKACKLVKNVVEWCELSSFGNGILSSCSKEE